MKDNKPEVILKVVYIDTSEYANKIKQSRIVVDVALEMLNACRYPIDKIIVEIQPSEE